MYAIITALTVYDYWVTTRYWSNLTGHFSFNNVQIKIKEAFFIYKYLLRTHHVSKKRILKEKGQTL